MVMSLNDYCTVLFNSQPIVIGDTVYYESYNVQDECISYGTGKVVVVLRTSENGYDIQIEDEYCNSYTVLVNHSIYNMDFIVKV